MTQFQQNTIRRLIVPSMVATFVVAAFICCLAGDVSKLISAFAYGGFTILVGMAVTANQLITRGDSDVGGGPVAASTTLYQGTMAFINATGYFDDDVAAGVNAFGGIVRQYVDNSSGAAGDKNVEVFREGQFKLAGTGFTQADVGKRVYATDNFTVTLTAGAATFIGYVASYVSSTAIMVDIVTASPSGTSSSAVFAKTADYTVTVADSGKTFTTVGAAGTVVFALPAAVVGLKYRFRVGAAQELRIDPDGTEVIALPSTGVAGAAGKYLTANADGETVEIECTKAGQWSVYGFTGTWTAEA